MDNMHKVFLGIWVLGFVFFLVGLAGLIANTAFHTVFMIVGILLSTAGFILFAFTRRGK